MTRKRRRHSAEFKARVGLEALKGIKTVNEIARDYEVHPVQVSHWKKELQERLPEVFEKPRKRDQEAAAREKEQLHTKIGQLTMKVDWLKKKCKQLQIPLDGER